MSERRERPSSTSERRERPSSTSERRERPSSTSERRERPSGTSEQRERPRGTSGRRRDLDPQGRRALFEMPVEAARDTIRSGDAKEGKDALYSTGPRQAGSVVVACGGCQVRTRISVTDVLMRLASISVWIPGRKKGHWMRCPACEQRHWCSIDWTA